MTIICYFGKWIEAIPIKDKSAIAAASAMFQTYFRHGAPASVITDQGREFLNKVRQTFHYLVGEQIDHGALYKVEEAVGREFHVTHRITSAYHPQSNGLTLLLKIRYRH